MDDNRQITVAEWQQWKQEIKDRLNQTVENFIAIGYRLRMIQETEAYRNDGFGTLPEWAKSEFGLSESTVNRFMAINARFTVGSRGTELLPEFREISYSKLQEMLTLSDEDCKLITASMTVKEIRELKQFNHDDEAKYIRTAEEKAKRTPLQECIWDFFAQPGNKVLLDETVSAIWSEDYGAAKISVIADNISPSGNRTHRKGIVYLFMYDAERGVAYKLMTSPMPVKLTWEAFLEEIRGTYAEYSGTPGSIWEKVYGRVEDPEAEIPGQVDITEVIPGETPVGEIKAEENQREDGPATSQDTETEKDDQEAAMEESHKEPENITGQTEIVEDVNKSAIFKPADRKNDREETTNADYTEPGASGNINDMPDGTDRGGAAGQPGNAGGVDREPEGVHGTGEDAGRDDSGNADGSTGGEKGTPLESGIPPHSVNTECGGSFTMTDEEWAILWNDMINDANNVYAFLWHKKSAFLLNGLSRSSLEEHYREAVNVAAGLEKVINGKKYSS